MKTNNKLVEKIREIVTQANTLGYSLEEMNEKITNELFKLTKDKITQTKQETLEWVLRQMDGFSTYPSGGDDVFDVEQMCQTIKKKMTLINLGDKK